MMYRSGLVSLVAKRVPNKILFFLFVIPERYEFGRAGNFFHKVGRANFLPKLKQQKGKFCRETVLPKKGIEIQHAEVSAGGSIETGYHNFILMGRYAMKRGQLVILSETLRT